MTETSSELALPDADLGKTLWIAIDDAKREADFATSMLTEAADQEEASRALVVLNTRLNELARIGEVTVEALKTLADVAHTLKTQRDEAIQERDNLQENMEEFGLELADEMTSEWLERNLPDTVDNEIEERAWERQAEEKALVEDLQGLGLADEAILLEETLQQAQQAKATADKMLEEAQKYLDENAPVKIGAAWPEIDAWEDPAFDEEDNGADDDSDTDDTGDDVA